MSFKTLCRSRMPVRSLLLAAMVGVLAGCGGGGGGGSEPAPAPVALDAQIAWQPTNFLASVAPLDVTRIHDIAVSSNGRVHVAWRTDKRDPVTDTLYDISSLISYSDDGGATWATTRFTDIEPINQILVMSTGMLVATGWDVSGVEFIADFKAGIWTSVDNGTTWQRRQLSRPASADKPAAPLWLVDGMAERNGQVLLVTKRHPDEPTYPAPEEMGVFLWDPVTDALVDWSFEFADGGWARELGGIAVAADGTVFLAKSQVESIRGQSYGAAVFRSATGAAWERLAPFDYDSVKMKDLTLLSDGTLLALHGTYYERLGTGRSDAQLHRSVDGHTWIEPAGVSGIATYGSQLIQLASGAIGMGDFEQFSCDRGATWQPATHGIYGLVRQAPDGTLWLGGGSVANLSGDDGRVYDAVMKAVPPAGIAARDFVKCP